MELFFVIGKILVFIWCLYLLGSLISNYLFLPARIKEKRKQWTRKDPLTLNIQTKKYSAHVPIKDWFLLSVGPILFCGMGTFFMIALEARTAEAAVIKHTVAGVMYSMGNTHRRSSFPLRNRKHLGRREGFVGTHHFQKQSLYPLERNCRTGIPSQYHARCIYQTVLSQRFD